MTHEDLTLGEKQWRWFDSERYGHKVGVVCYENAVVVHFPAGIGDGGMDVKWTNDERLSDGLGKLYRQGLEAIGSEYDQLERKDGVALRRTVA